MVIDKVKTGSSREQLTVYFTGAGPGLALALTRGSLFKPALGFSFNLNAALAEVSAWALSARMADSTTLSVQVGSP